jgi:hypothetical protein
MALAKNSADDDEVIHCDKCGNVIKVPHAENVYIQVEQGMLLELCEKCYNELNKKEEGDYYK